MSSVKYESMTLFLFSALFDSLFVNLPYNCVRG